MQSLRCLRLLSRPAVTFPSTALLRPSIPLISAKPSTLRNLSILTPRRPQLPSTTILPSLTPTTTTSISQETLDLLPKISAHPALLGQQIRCGPRDTFSPSHFVRKRRHGFLARLKSRTGRKILKRRRAKGRYRLSH